jgi:hypothetical protein
MGAALGLMGLALGVPDAAGQIYVDDDAPPGGDGLSWQTAFRDVQDALDALHGLPKPRVHIAQGRYWPSPTWVDDRRSFVLGDLGLTSGMTIAIRAGYAGLAGPGDPDEFNPAQYITIFDGDINQDDIPGDDWSRRENSNTVFLIDSDVPVVVALSGVTIMNGMGRSWDYFSSGGGAAIRSLGPVALQLTDSRLFNNSARSGGALFANEGRIVAMRCVFEDNDALYGGAASITGEAGAEFDLCIFRRNRAAFGGAVYGSMQPEGQGEIRLGTCLLTGNEASSLGGGVCAIGGTLILAGCTLWDNQAGEAAAVFAQTSWGRISSSIVWGQSAPPLIELAGTRFFRSRVTVDENIIRGGLDGIGLTSEGVVPRIRDISGNDPLLVDPVGPDGVRATGDEDFNPTPTSHAIDSGNSNYQYGFPDIDLDGDPRELGDIDIGAYEMRCLADLTGSSDPADPEYGIPDGEVNSADYDYFLAAFERGDPRMDLSGSTDPADPRYNRPDGVVDMTDFFRFLDDLANPCYP